MAASKGQSVAWQHWATPATRLHQKAPSQQQHAMCRTPALALVALIGRAHCAHRQGPHARPVARCAAVIALSERCRCAALMALAGRCIGRRTALAGRCACACVCLWPEPRQLLLTDADEVVTHNSCAVHNPCAACPKEQLMQPLNQGPQRLQLRVASPCLLQQALELALVLQGCKAERLNPLCTWLSEARRLRRWSGGQEDPKPISKEKKISYALGPLLSSNAGIVRCACLEPAKV